MKIKDMYLVVAELVEIEVELKLINHKIIINLIIIANQF